MCRLARGFFFLVGVWVTGAVTLVVHSVLTGVFSANPHLLKGDLPAPGDDHIVDIDGVMPRPEYPLIYPQESPLEDEGFDQPLHMPDREPGNGSETLIGDPGMLAKHIGFGKDGV